MAKQVNKIRKSKLKKELLTTNKSVRQALKDSGYSDATAHNSTTNTVVKICMEEIEREFKEENITVSSVLKEIELGIKLCLDCGNLAVYKELITLKAKYLGMLKDKQEITSISMDKDEDLRYKELRRELFGSKN